MRRYVKIFVCMFRENERKTQIVVIVVAVTSPFAVIFHLPSSFLDGFTTRHLFHSPNIPNYILFSYFIHRTQLVIAKTFSLILSQNVNSINVSKYA